MLFLFDLDDTLIKGYMAEPGRPKQPYEQVKLLPDRRQRLLTLKAQGHALGLITNQGGVAFGYQTEADFARKLEAVQAALGLEFNVVVVAFGHPDASDERYRKERHTRWRKPSGRGVRWAARQLREQAAQGVIVIGDREEDRLAAADAGALFSWADAFFEPWEPTYRRRLLAEGYGIGGSSSE